MRRAPKPVGRAIRNLACHNDPMVDIPNYIDGTATPPRSGAWLDDIEPATGRVHARLADSDERDVAAAVTAARDAFPGWAALPAARRSEHLLTIAAGIEARLEEFARAESADTGKPLSLARTLDIPRAIANFRFFATAILHTASEAHQTDGTALNVTLRRPRGVAGLISPWNLPLYLLSWKIAPALATGNTAVAKPSELTPLTAHLLAEVCAAAGLPPGVLNLVHGRGATAGAALTAHPDVPALSFTGGTSTGAAVAQAAAPLFKKVSLELGGKNPTIVFDDVDLGAVLPAIVRASFANQGQICLCGSRVFVQRGLYAAFVERFAAAVAALRVGDPLDPDTDQGALISAEHYRKIEGYVALAREEGGTIVAGGAPAPAPNERCRNGLFYRPTVITGLDMNCRVNREEIFGPVVTVLPFDDEEDLLAQANGVSYGLAASVWTNDLNRAWRVAPRLDVGTVWINCWLLRDLRVPFGGMKQSGVGREGGEEALRFFTEPKNVCVRLPDEGRPSR